jgi:hypothetical protein
MCALKLAGLSPIELIVHGAEELAREQAEGMRLAYVAATRARDVLVVPVLGDGPYEGGWLDPLMPAVYPPEKERRSGARVAGCPAFPSKDSVLTRPDGDPAKPTTVAPGAHAFNGGAPSTNYSVVWWDPHSLALGAESSFGLTRDDLIVKDGDMFAVDEKLADYERWKSHTHAVVAGASRPTLRVATVTAWAHETSGEPEENGDGGDTFGADIDIVKISSELERPFGPRFGTLVHATLATVPLDATADIVAHVAGTQSRIVGATSEEQRAAVRAVENVLAHPLLERARAAAARGGCHRELPVTWMAPDGLLLEGSIDLAFEDADSADQPNRWCVLDFKTDRLLAPELDQYRRQLAVYCRALEQARSQKAQGLLVLV